MIPLVVTAVAAAAKRPNPPSPVSSSCPDSSLNPRPTKRLKTTTAVSPASADTDINMAGLPLQIAPVIKRIRHAGKLRRLALPRVALPSVRPASTLGGAKIGGKAKDLSAGGGGVRGRTKDGEERIGMGGVEELWIGKKGMKFGGWLKKGVAAFIERGVKIVHIHSMGAAIPMALSIGLAIRDAVPGGADALDMNVKTDSIAVADEITPDDQELDLIYQTRLKSTVIISLSLNARSTLGDQRVGQSHHSRGNTGADRGSRRRGRGRGSRGGRGRGT